MARSSSPTVELLIAFTFVFLLQRLLPGDGLGLFALALPLGTAPWTVVTSVYAHASVSHLVSNAAALALVGFVLERFTTRVRFHAFVLATGALAGITEVVVGGLLGGSAAVVGASGGVLALYGYVLGGNRLTGGLLDRVSLSRRAKVVLVAAVALLATLATAGSGVALVAHATGFVIGLLSGRFGVLNPRPT